MVFCLGAMHMVGHLHVQAFVDVTAHGPVEVFLHVAVGHRRSTGQALRDGAGPQIGLHFDTNFNFRAEGFLRMARALEPYDLEWLEADSFDAAGLAQVRAGTRTPIASCETLTGLRQLR